MVNIPNMPLPLVIKQQKEIEDKENNIKDGKTRPFFVCK